MKVLSDILHKAGILKEGAETYSSGGYAVLVRNSTTQRLETVPSSSLVPDQTGNSGKYLTTDGSVLSWGTVSTANIYNSDGTLTGNRTVMMGSFTLSFEKDLLVNGHRAGRGLGGIQTNTTFGNNAGSSTTSPNNTTIGNNAGANITSLGNTIVGSNAVQSGNLSGSSNSVFGFQTYLGGTGANNNYFGAYSAQIATSGSSNCGFGNESLRYLTGGSNNAAFGFQSLYSNTANNNTSLGYYSGGANTTGSNNIFIGYNSTGVSPTESNRTWIGNSSTISTWLAGNVLIGTTTDSGYKLDVQGTARVTGVLTIGNTGASFDIAYVTGGLGNINLGGSIGATPDRTIAVGGVASCLLSTAVGMSATASGGGTAIGGYVTSAIGGIAIGSAVTGATAVGNRAIAIGGGTSAYGENNAVAINGNIGTSVNNSNGIAILGTVVGGIGNGSIALLGYAGANQSVAIYGSTSAGNEFVAGAAYEDLDMANFAITNVYFGSGKQRANTGGVNRTGAGIAYTINGSGSFGTDYAGGNITIAGGKGTGTGTPGDVIFSTATSTASGTTLQTLTNRVWIKGENGNVGIGASPNAAYKLDVQGSLSIKMPAGNSTGFQLLNYDGVADWMFYNNGNNPTNSRPFILVPRWSVGTPIQISGANTSNTANNAILIGGGANSSSLSNKSIRIGLNAGGNVGEGSIIIGTGTATGNYSISMSTDQYGISMGNVPTNNSFYIGSAVEGTTTAASQGVLGVIDIYIGRPAKSSNPAGNTYQGTATSINGMGGYGVTDSTGGTLRINGGVGLGSGTPGDVIIGTATATSSGTTIQALTDRVWIKGENGNVGIGASPNASYKLDVQGTIRSTGDGLFNDITIGQTGGGRYIKWGLNDVWMIAGSTNIANFGAGGVTIPNTLVAGNGTTINEGSEISGYTRKLTFPAAVNHTQTHVFIRQSDAAYGGNTTQPGNIWIYPGKNTTNSSFGNIHLAHDGTEARGRVAIGSASAPLYTLDVTGTARVTGDALVNGLTVGIGSGAVSTNTTFGFDALDTNTTGGGNTVLGYAAMQYTTTASSNTVIGYQSGYQLASNNNTGVGFRSIWKGSTGSNNTGIGSHVMEFATGATGEYNTAVGSSYTMAKITSGSFNVGIGNGVLRELTSGVGNVALGQEALPSITTTNGSVAIGAGAFYFNTGGNNIAIGQYGGRTNTTGEWNIYLGTYNQNSEPGITTGSYNTIIGSKISGLAASLSNNIVLADGQGNIRIRAFDTGNVTINSGTDAGFKLDVAGTGRFTNMLSVITTGTTNEVALFKSTEPYISIEAAGASNSASLFFRPSTASQNATIQNRTGGGLEFYTGATPSLAATITAANNLVIGTVTAAGQKLQVTSASADSHLLVWGATAPSIRIDNAATGSTQRFVLGLATATNNFITGAVAGDICLTTQSSSPLLFGANATEVMRLSTSSNVLIGKTTDGGQRLQVNGKVNLASLPTSASGLSSGDLWNNGGVINIV